MVDPGLAAQGLSEQESLARLATEGPNELAREKERGLFAAVAAVVKEPMLLLLLGAGAIYLLLGDLEEALAALRPCWW